MRKDLGLSHGKMAAQVAHASVGASSERCLYRLKERLYLTDYATDINHWFDNAFAKVVLEVKTKAKMLNLIDKLSEECIPHSIIMDACRTELVPEDNGRTLTCVGLVPMFRDRVPKFLRRLQVYE